MKTINFESETDNNPIKLIGEDHYRVELTPRSSSQFVKTILAGMAEDPDRPFMIDVHLLEKDNFSNAVYKLTTKGIGNGYHRHIDLNKHNTGLGRFVFFKEIRVPEKDKDKLNFYFTAEEVDEARTVALNTIHGTESNLKKALDENSEMKNEGDLVDKVARSTKEIVDKRVQELEARADINPKKPKRENYNPISEIEKKRVLEMWKAWDNDHNKYRDAGPHKIDCFKMYKEELSAMDIHSIKHFRHVIDTARKRA